MASAYKSATRKDHDSDSDDLGLLSSDESSHTVEPDSPLSGTSDEDVPPRKPTSTLDQLPVELRNRVLMLTSRGVSYRWVMAFSVGLIVLTDPRHRHLLTDLHSLLPHTYKDTKLDTKSSNNYNSALNALADLHSCNYIFFLEARKHGEDLYVWLANVPNGPTIKFSVSNVHTMGELDFGGNCLKGGRGVVVFDRSFDDDLQNNEHRTLIREMLKGVFCVPSKGVRGMKPFVDRIIGIYGLDGKIWIRIYEIRETEKKDGQDLPTGSATDVTLIEIGPRMVLTPIVILEGSFGGPVIFENKEYVSANQVRSEARVRKASRYASRRGGVEERVIKRKSLGLESGVKRKRSSLDDAELFR